MIVSYHHFRYQLTSCLSWWVIHHIKVPTRLVWCHWRSSNQVNESCFVLFQENPNMYSKGDGVMRSSWINLYFLGSSRPHWLSWLSSPSHPALKTHANFSPLFKAGFNFGRYLTSDSFERPTMHCFLQNAKSHHMINPAKKWAQCAKSKQNVH